MVISAGSELLLTTLKNTFTQFNKRHSKNDLTGIWDSFIKSTKKVTIKENCTPLLAPQFASHYNDFSFLKLMFLCLCQVLHTTPPPRLLLAPTLPLTLYSVLTDVLHTVGAPGHMS